MLSWLDPITLKDRKVAVRRDDHNIRVDIGVRITIEIATRLEERRNKREASRKN